MSLVLPTTVTGGAQTGFTTPGYGLTVGSFPGTNGYLNYVTSITGTQAGVRTHSVSDPFTLSAFAPVSPKGLGSMNSQGIYVNVPLNVYGLTVRKGLFPAANQPASNGSVDVRVKLPAGADSYDTANARAMLSLAIGALQSMSAAMGDSAISGQK